MQPKATKRNLLSLLQKVANDSLNDVSSLRFDRKHPHHLYSVCLYGTIIELTYGCMALIEKQQLSAFPAVFRGLLEAYADFRVCLREPEYFKSMNASFLKEKLRALNKTMTSPGNPYLAGLGRSDPQGEKTALESELAELQAKGHIALGVWDRFSKAGLEEEYQSIYWLLCLDAHNNVSSLEDRHIEKQGSDYRVVLFREEDLSDLIRYFDTLIATVIDSTMKIHEFLDSGVASRYQEHLRELDVVRKDYTS
jgi:hypothetical protein